MHFFESFSSKHLEVTRKVYNFAFALQNKPPGKLLKAVKKEFFEKIYINREVVQEASVWFYIKWMGKRNEPINSLSLLLRHRLKIIKEQEKRCFLLDTFRISVLKQRLLGGVLGVNVVFIITYHLSLITNTYFTMESLILAQDER